MTAVASDPVPVVAFLRTRLLSVTTDGATRFPRHRASPPRLDLAGGATIAADQIVVVALFTWRADPVPTLLENTGRRSQAIATEASGDGAIVTPIVRHLIAVITRLPQR
jgi:hypothetical protein